jgi:hypothetical protein
MRSKATIFGSLMNAARAKTHFPFVFITFGSACNAEIAHVTSITTVSTSNFRTKVICPYAPSQSSVVSHLTVTAGGAAIGAASVAQPATPTAVLHSSGA